MRNGLEEELTTSTLNKEFLTLTCTLDLLSSSGLKLLLVLKSESV